MTSRSGAFRPLRDERGTAAVEFALILLPLVVLIIGVVDFGRVLYTRNNMIEAADLGARMILLDNAVADAEVATEIREAFIAGPGESLAVIIGTVSESGIHFRTLAVSYQVGLLTPFLVTDGITMAHTRRVPLE